MPSRSTRRLILPFAALLASAAATSGQAAPSQTAPTQAAPPQAATTQAASPHGIDVCTVTGTSGQYSVRVRNTTDKTLSHADVVGVHLNAAGQGGNTVTVNLQDVPPGKYKTAVLARHGESAALVSIATYQTVNGVDTPQQELYAGKVAHVAPGSALQYTLAPLALRGWTVAYGTAQSPKLEPGSAVLLIYPARTGKKRDVTRPDAGRAPADVVPLLSCATPRKH
ncbi:hypothetical protein [Achromobacter animicus]|uniref:hypothetical protein n=1 Tax=Achromobacter TaxID=222 RepID=UPI001EF37BEF|nr:hypothetical protein [Achromobacter animicus]MCG7325093.1 hypothetical protein [Achromobacter sp. ACRQX]MDH0681081.1 hypothetical protein [Achromobacter animicus]